MTRENDELAKTLTTINATHSPNRSRRGVKVPVADATALLEQAGQRLSGYKIDARWVRKYLRAFAMVAEQALSEGKAVKLPGLGTLTPRLRKASRFRRGTGVSAESPYVLSITFRPSRALREIVKEGFLLDIREKKLGEEYKQRVHEEKRSVVIALARRAKG